MGQYIKINNEWKHVIAVYKKVSNNWTEQVQYSFDNNIYIYDPTVIDDDVLVIVAENSYTGKNFYLVANLNGRRIYPDWTLVSGDSYASINQNGKVTILSAADNSQITVRATYGFLNVTANMTVTYDNQLTIEGSDTMSGTSGNVIALYNNAVVTPTWSITSGNNYATINSSGEITIIADGEITVSATYSTYSATKVITLTYNANQSSQTQVDPNTGAITTTETTTSTDPETGATTETSTSTITNTDGSTASNTTETTTNPDGSSTTSSTTTHSNGTLEESSYTTSSPDSDGAVTTVETYVVTYTDGSSETTNSTVVENEDGSSESQYSTATYDENGNQTSSSDTEITVSAPDENGAVTTETSIAVTNSDGTSSESTSTKITNEDGSSSSQSETIRYDENGDVTGSTTGTSEVAADGSSESSTTNYNANGDPTDQQNVGIDTTGNINTQDVEFDENGDPTVVGFDIDTTASDGAGKEIEGDGINTEFVPFKFASEGFVMHMVFRTVASEQPRPPITEDTEDTGTSYMYNIFSAKATYKINNIWPGFELRWVIAKSGNGTSGQLQFNRTLSGETTSSRTDIVSGHDGNNVYDITVTYNPSLSTNKFIVYNNITHANIQAVNKTLQNDIDLDLRLGYTVDHNGDPIRQANVTFYDFSVSRLSS